MTTILGKIRLLRTTSETISNEVLEEGRMAYLTDENVLVSGDGLTAGSGLPRIASLNLIDDLNLNGNRIIDSNTSSVIAAAGLGNFSVMSGISSASGLLSLAAIGGTADGTYSAAVGYNAKATGYFGLATGSKSHARLKGEHAHAAFSYGAGITYGHSQCITIQLGRITTNATPATLSLDSGSPGSDDRLSVPSGFVISGIVHILGVKSDGSQAAHYTRQFTIKNVGGTTSLVGAVQTVGTDVEDDASWDVAITADDTNDAVQINVTGAAATTIRWMARFTGVEMEYGT